MQISVLDFSRDRKMMSVLCSRKQKQIMFSKGAPESIISRCTNILCNGDGSTVPLTANIRAELESRFHRFDSFCASPFHYLFLFPDCSCCNYLYILCVSTCLSYIPNLIMHKVFFFFFLGGVWFGDDYNHLMNLCSLK